MGRVDVRKCRQLCVIVHLAYNRCVFLCVFVCLWLHVCVCMWVWWVGGCHETHFDARTTPTGPRGTAVSRVTGFQNTAQTHPL